MAGSPKTLKRTVARVVGLAAGLTVGLSGVLTAGLIIGLAAGLGIALACWSIEMARVRHSQPLVIRARWPNRSDLSFLASMLAVPVGSVLAAGLVAGVFAVGVGAASMRTAPFVAALAPLLMVVLVGGLTFGLMAVWSWPAQALKITEPEQIYRSDRSRTVVFGLGVGLLTGLSLGLSVRLDAGLGLGVGLPAGLGFGFVSTEGSAVELLVMGLTWRLRGKRVRFIPLLHTAAERQILRRVGAIYQFRHVALQDLLATSYRQPR